MKLLLHILSGILIGIMLNTMGGTAWGTSGYAIGPMVLAGVGAFIYAVRYAD